MHPASLPPPVRKWFPAAAIVIAFAMAAAVAACGRSPTVPPAPPRTPVRVTAAWAGPAIPPITTEGVLANKDEVRLAFKVGGVVAEVTVHAGEPVRRGQLLARLEPPEVDARVDQARALAEKAQRDVARGERLYADQVISLEQLQDLRTQARLQAAQLHSAEFERSYAAIRSPADGVVLRRLAEPHELVAPGQPVLAIGSRMRGVIVRAALSDREIVQLKLGDRAAARLDPFPAQEFAGEVSEISRAADERTGMFPVEVRLSAPAATMASGMVARLRFVPSSPDSLVYVPPAAILEGDARRASVFVLDAGRARRRVVEVGFITEQGVALRSGLRAGDTVISEGALYLEDGDAVDVVPAGSSAALAAHTGSAG